MSKRKEAIAKWRESLTPALGSDFNGLDQEALHLVELAWQASRMVALEEAANECDKINDAEWDAFDKASVNDQRRARNYTEGRSAATEDCRAAILALKEQS